MRGYVFVDKTNGNVDCVYSWGDNRDLPSICEPALNQAVIVVVDIEAAPVDFSYCYDFDAKVFKKKLEVTIDDTQISHIDGIAHITISYPEQVNDVVKFIVDDQSVDVNVVNGTVTVPFVNQVVGVHSICVESITHWGKSYAAVEVI